MVAAEVQVNVIEDKREKPEEVQKEVNNGLLCLSGLHFKYVSALTSLKIRLQSRRQQETEKKTKSQLLTAGVGARRQVDKEHRSGLYLAAENNHLRCVKTLLKTGVRAELLNRNDRWDNTALHIASIRGHLDIVTALIEAGAQIDNKNEDEQTPLHVAAKHGKLIFLRKLMYCTFNLRILR